MNSSLYDIIIVGAGASGLICALECARAGKKVLILERQPIAGRKILVSGNGRCNFTNRFVSPSKYYPSNSPLIKNTLSSFPFQKCVDYFSSLGILYVEEEQGRFFPFTGKATAITDAFKAALAETSVEIAYNQEVTRIQHASFFTVYTKETTFKAKKLVLACGSCAYPQVSGTTLGYTLAQQLGHSIISPIPSLSGWTLKENFSRLSGIRAKVKLTFQKHQTEGEIIFTNYGMNGPAALNMTPILTRLLSKQALTVTINFLVQVPHVQPFLTERFRQFPFRKPKEFFAGIVHESIANLLIDFKGLRKNKPLQEQNPSTLKNAFETLEHWPITVTGLRPWNEAMIAAGGVNTREINYNTCESLLCPGLFITGELLDIDAISGGYNLHFAWASGFSAAQELVKEK